MRILGLFHKWNSVAAGALATGAFVIGAPLLFAGCELTKFGNSTETELSGYDTISGYYASLPQSVNFTAKIGTSAERSKNGTMNQMPDFLKLVMANPTLLYFDYPVGGAGSLRARGETETGIPTKIEEKLGRFGASSNAFADVSGCRLAQDIVNSGTFSQYNTNVDIGGVSARGRVSLDYTIKYTLVGSGANCDPVRARFQTCYVDNVNCAADAASIFYPAFVYEMFDPLVNSGTITPSEIGSFREIGYRARYE